MTRKSLRLPPISSRVQCSLCQIHRHEYVIPLRLLEHSALDHPAASNHTASGQVLPCHARGREASRHGVRKCIALALLFQPCFRNLVSVFLRSCLCYVIYFLIPCQHKPNVTHFPHSPNYLLLPVDPLSRLYHLSCIRNSVCVFEAVTIPKPSHIYPC